MSSDPREPHRPVEERSPVQLSWTGDRLVAWWFDGREISDPTKRPLPGGAPQRHTPGGSQSPLAVVTRALGVYPGAMHTIAVELPTGRQTAVGFEIPPFGLFGPNRRGKEPASASVAWVEQVVRCARDAVRTGRAIPQLTFNLRGHWVARWEPVWDDLLVAAAHQLADAIPPVVTAVSALEMHPPADPDAVVAQMLTEWCDVFARNGLYALKWSPASLRGVRGEEALALRRIAAALSSGDPVVEGLNESVETAMPRLATGFDMLRARAAGQPVVAARLRLGLPEGPDALWPVTMELYDIGDASRWCTALDVAGATPLAMDIAGSERFLSALEHAIAGTLDRLALIEGVQEPFARWLSARRDLDTLDLDDVGATALLDHVPQLIEAGITLQAPSQLVPANPALRGTATPKAEGSGKFRREAIVEWTMVVDNVPIDEATLQRAAEVGSSLMNVDGRWVRLDLVKARKALARIKAERAEHSEVDAVTLLRLAASTDLEIAAPDVAAPDDTTAQRTTGSAAAVAAARWTSQLINGLPDTTLKEGEEPANFTFPLRPYQRRGLGWMRFLDELGLGGCLADDMGLGKTPTTLAHLAGRPGPHLVICPLSVVRNWQKEADRFSPLQRIYIHHGGERRKGAELQHAVAEADIVVSTYGLVARDIALLSDIEWNTLVMDEAQSVKNAHTNAAKAVRKLKAGQRLALTGTPVENRLLELWAILDAVNPGLLGSESSFQHRWANPIEKERDEDTAAALRRLTSPFVLRRTKADKSLVPDLPDKVETIAFATLTKEQATMYQAVVDQLLQDSMQESGMKRRGLVLASLTRLKQICNHPAHALGDGSKLAGRSGKLARFDELVDDFLDAEERALVFTQYREMGELLQRHMAERLGLQVPFLHGGVPKARRDRMVEQFQAGDGAPLLFVSLKAGGTGLNLTAASRVVHYDRWWNPAVEDQATDRAWRLGQKNAVFVNKLVCQGTVEERISELIDDKRAIAGAVVGSTGEAWLSELSTDSLRDLVRLDKSAVATGKEPS